jgi:hypothetical protein
MTKIVTGESRTSGNRDIRTSGNRDIGKEKPYHGSTRMILIEPEWRGNGARMAREFGFSISAIFWQFWQLPGPRRGVLFDDPVSRLPDAPMT